MACYFQGNCWKLGASIIRVLENSRPTACNFQGNSWKLGAFIIQVIGELLAYCLQFPGEHPETIPVIGKPAIFRETPGNWGHP